jgi:protein-disulfide isomerase
MKEVISYLVYLANHEFKTGKKSSRIQWAQGTPTLFINGDRYDSAWDLDSLLSALD